MLGNQSDMLKTLKVSQPQRDTLGTLKVLWTHGTHWGPKKCHSHKGRAGDPKGHIGDPKGVVDPWDTSGTQSNVLGTQKVSQPHRDTLGTLKVPQTQRMVVIQRDT